VNKCSMPLRLIMRAQKENKVKWHNDSAELTNIGLQAYQL
jgi:hypothetical protein